MLWRKEEDEHIWGCAFRYRCKGLKDLRMESTRKGKDFRRKSSSLSVPNGILKEIFTVNKNGN